MNNENKEFESQDESKIIRNFKLTSLALNNRTSVYLITIMIVIFGMYSYKQLPKELFPDIAFPWIMVQTVYSGNPPSDIENLITRPIEKEIESINGIKKITSTSSQDFSFVMIEFNPDVEIKTALNDVKDAVDRARNELPSDLTTDPLVKDIDPSEFPIMNINLSGDYSTDELKKFAETLQDRIESLPEISKVAIQGINEKEIKINVDINKLQAVDMSFNDIENAVKYENMSVSAGDMKLDGFRRTVRTVGEFTEVNEIKNVIVKDEDGQIVYLRDVADVVNGYEDPTSYTRMDNKPVVSLQVVKKGGENLLNAAGKIEKILAEVKSDHVFPSDLEISVTNDQSDSIKKQLNNLENSMIISMLFVIGILFFFLGTRNALFVGLAIPMSMFLSFIILQAMGYRINMMVLFGLILALGMLVDNAIVAVENIYRFVDNGYSKFEATKQAVGEIAIPIITSTLTTLAAFVPLAFWQGIVGEFMKFLPITLIVVLTSSLFVALVIIPVFTAELIKLEKDERPAKRRRSHIIALVLAVLAVLFFVIKVNVMGNLLAFGAVLTMLNYYLLRRMSHWFKDVFLSWLENFYSKVLAFSLRGKNPILIFVGSIVLMFVTMGWYFGSGPTVLFFPNSDPSYINIMAELPKGTDISQTDKFGYELDGHIKHLLTPYKDVVKSVVINVGDGAVLENSMSVSSKENKCLVTITFVDFTLRQDVSTKKILKELSDSLLGYYPGVVFTFEKNSMGPPTGEPINIEITGTNFENLILLSDSLQTMIEASGIEGIEGLKMDLNVGNPEMLITIDRDKARRFGLSTGQIASTIRTALFGKEISKFKEGEDEYPIQLRINEEQRNDVATLMNQKITFRNNKGKLMKVPISAVASYQFNSNYGEIKRKDLDRVITLYSNVLEGYNATSVNKEIKTIIASMTLTEGYNIKQTGEQQDQAESSDFLARAMLIAVALILLILVAQFNSVVKPFIIITSVLLSTIGVFGGLATFNMDFIVIMTGIGIVSLAGIAVNNAIVLIDYIDLLKARKLKELGLNENAFLPINEATECIVEAGKTRLRPVLLTAITTILGLFPMAIGLNIDFISLLTSFDPQISFGGDMAAIWSPISWTIIFGLSFTTILTLVVVPVMYRLSVRLQKVGHYISAKFMPVKDPLNH